MTVCLFVLILGILPAGQDSYPSGTIYFQAADYSGPPVAGAPYCAEQRHVKIVTQPDGIQETLEYAPVKICRDSEGRTRYEHPVWLQPGGPSVGPPLIQIRDPVAGAKYVIYAVDKTVYRQRLQPRRAMHPPLKPPFPADPEVFRTQEDLGTQMMGELQVEGRRYTVTKTTTTIEEWWSPALGEFLLEKTASPADGELTHTLIHVALGEPDPDLFRLPPDYAIVDEPGDFAILWGQ